MKGIITIINNYHLLIIISQIKKYKMNSFFSLFDVMLKIIKFSKKMFFHFNQI